jgi:hypothetical protein
MKTETKRLTRTTGPGKLGAVPHSLGRTKINNITRSTFRFNSTTIFNDLPLVLQDIKKPVNFRNRLFRYLRNNNDLPENFC